MALTHVIDGVWRGSRTGDGVALELDIVLVWSAERQKLKRLPRPCQVIGASAQRQDVGVTATELGGARLGRGNSSVRASETLYLRFLTCLAVLTALIESQKLPACHTMSHDRLRSRVCYEVQYLCLRKTICRRTDGNPDLSFAGQQTDRC